MKTKTFLLLCLFLGIGLTQLSAQTFPEGTKSVSFVDIYYCPLMPVTCGGTIVDYLEGTIEGAHWIVHFNAGKSTPDFGNFQWQRCQARGELTGTSGEVFEVKAVACLNLLKAGLTTEINYLLKGDRGNLIKLTCTMTCDGVYTFEKAICN